jgi:hypothetical protein
MRKRGAEDGAGVGRERFIERLLVAETKIERRILALRFVALEFIAKPLAAGLVER